MSLQAALELSQNNTAGAIDAIRKYLDVYANDKDAWEQLGELYLQVRVLVHVVSLSFLKFCCLKLPHALPQLLDVYQRLPLPKLCLVLQTHTVPRVAMCKRVVVFTNRLHGQHAEASLLWNRLGPQ